MNLTVPSRLLAMLLVVVILITISCRCDGFVVQIKTTTRTTTIQRPPYSYALLTAKNDHSIPEDGDVESTLSDDSAKTNMNRRTVFQKTSAAAAAVLLSSSLGSVFSTEVAEAAVTTLGKNSADTPVVILGGGGKVGTICTRLLASENTYCRSVTRSGRQVLDDSSQYVAYSAADVSDYESVQNVVKGATAVIFAASASGKKKGGDPAHVDYKGLYNTAKACIAENVGKLIIVSSAAVTRPDSIGFKATNTFVKFVYGDKIMDYKIAGENLVRDLYASSGKPDLSYTILRPGGLSELPSVGSTKLQASQGDIYVSEITREDVARVCIAALQSNASDNATFEINQIEGIYKAMKSLPDPPSELVKNGAPTYVALLDGLKPDTLMKEKYSSLLSTFGGSGIEPIDKVV